MQLAFQIDAGPTMPALGFYQSSASHFSLPTIQYQRLASVQGIRFPIAIGGSENANATVTLDNGDGELMNLFSLPPLAQQASILGIVNNQVLTLFSGTIISVSVSTVIRISVES